MSFKLGLQESILTSSTLIGGGDATELPLFSVRISADFDSKKYSLNLVIRKGEVGAPLIVGFPGYLSNPEGYPSYYGQVGGDPDLSRATLITINDRHGFERDGSWYLGERLDNGIFSYQLLITNAIKYFESVFSPSKVIFYGTSMGGFGALHYSLICNPDETYLCVPQTTLSPASHYWRRGANGLYYEMHEESHISRHLQYLGIETRDKFYSTLKQNPLLDISYFSDAVLRSSSNSINHPVFGEIKFCPYYHLVSSRYDHHQDVDGVYFDQMILPLITAFSKSKVHFSSSIFPYPTHDRYIWPDNVFYYSKSILPGVMDLLPSRSGALHRTTAKKAMGDAPFWRPFMTNQA